jgi:hypothetical protein
MVRFGASQATGTAIDANRRDPSRFVVEIRYREPSYEVHHGARPEPYRFRYRLEAPSEQAAVAFAVAEFERMNALSSVGWTRLIVAILVEPAIEPHGAPR